MKLKNFNQFILENRDLGQAEADSIELGKTAQSIKDLLDLGLINDSGYRREFSEVVRSYKKIVKGLQLNPKEKIDLEILKKLGKLSGINAIHSLDSPAADALFAKGLHMVSSPTQLMNGTIVFSLDPNYRRADGWGIGFFPGPKIIRRMMPKGINIGVWGRRLGSMDILIKKFPNTSSEPDFFSQAMLWAAENIDFDHVKQNPEPATWKYYTKKTVKNKEHKHNENN